MIKVRSSFYNNNSERIRAALKEVKDVKTLRGIESLLEKRGIRTVKVQRAFAIRMSELVTREIA